MAQTTLLNLFTSTSGKETKEWVKRTVCVHAHMRVPVMCECVCVCVCVSVFVGVCV